MDKKKKSFFRKGPALIAVTLLAAAAAGYVYAYMTDADRAENRFTQGAVETEITEDFPEQPAPLPGSHIVKKVSIENTGPNDCFVRVQLLFSDSSAEGLCSLNHPDTENWHFEDGWWYYRQILRKGDTTTPVMDGLTVSEEADIAEIHPFEIYVRQESVHYEGQSDAVNAFRKADREYRV